MWFLSQGKEEFLLKDILCLERSYLQLRPLPLNHTKQLLRYTSDFSQIFYPEM